MNIVSISTPLILAFRAAVGLTLQPRGVLKIVFVPIFLPLELQARQAELVRTFSIMTVQSTQEMMRSASRKLLSVQHWKARLVLWSAGAAVGAAAVAFAWLADTAQALFRG